MPWCNFCHKDFPTRVGFAVHKARSKNPACRAQRFPPGSPRPHRRHSPNPNTGAPSSSDAALTDADDSESALEDNLHEDEDNERPSPPRFFAGDYFGNDYVPADLPGWGVADEDVAMQDSSDAVDPGSDDGHEPDGPPLSDNEDDALEEEAEANEEQWEPVRTMLPDPSPPSNLSTTSEPEPTSGDTAHEPPDAAAATPSSHTVPIPSVNEAKQKRMEDALRRKVHIMKFPSDVAGSPTIAEDSGSTHEQAPSGYTAYEHKLEGHRADNANTIYAPFTSRIDWDVARWSKLRGPGSTALSELLSIDGVRHTIFLFGRTMLTWKSGFPRSKKSWASHSEMFEK